MRAMGWSVAIHVQQRLQWVEGGRVPVYAATPTCIDDCCPACESSLQSRVQLSQSHSLGSSELRQAAESIRTGWKSMAVSLMQSNGLLSHSQFAFNGYSGFEFAGCSLYVCGA
jgi:hypothetical protein